MKFTEFNFNENVMKGINDAGFTECTPVQDETYSNVLKKKKDITVQSQTGTGKTAAFLISIFELMLEEKGRKKALIIAPTRELAVQIEEEANILGAHLPFKAGSFYGGVGYFQQEKIIKEGVDIIIGTPGRLLDLNKSGKLVLKDVDMFVIDEADRLFDMGFFPELKRILSVLPSLEERLTMLFSATLSTRVRNLAWEYLNEPITIEIAPESITVDDITQELYHASKNEKLSLLLGIIKDEKPETALLFTNTKHGAVELSKRLSHNGIKCEYLMGDLPQKKRLNIINSVKSGKIKYLVATDVAARGLHIENLELVVNYDIPEDCESYVHRIGRTARAGKKGKAVSIACEKYVFGLEAIEKFTGMKIPVIWPEEDFFSEDKSSGMRFSDDRYNNRNTNPRGNRSSGNRSNGNRSSGNRSSGNRSNGNRPSGNRPSGNRSDRSQSKHNSGGYKPARKRDTSADIERTAAVQAEIAAVIGGKTGLKNDADKKKESKNNNRNGKTAAAIAKSEHKTPEHSGVKRNRKKYQEKKENSGKDFNRTDKFRKPSTNDRKIRERGKNLEERLSYYKEKYGEDFKAGPEVISIDKDAETKKKPFFNSIKSFFRK